MNHEELARRYKALARIAWNVSDVLALVAKVIKEPLKADEARGLVWVLDRCRVSMYPALSPPEESKE
jgi:hypothetical protein